MPLLHFKYLLVSPFDEFFLRNGTSFLQMVAVLGLHVHAQTPHVHLSIFIRHVLFVFLLFKFTSITQFLSSASLSPYRSAFNQSGTLGENRTEKYEESYFSGRRNAFSQPTLVRYP